MNVIVGNTELDGHSFECGADFMNRLGEEPILAGDDEGRSVMRGVLTAVIISVPFWSLFGFALYLLF